MDTALRAASRIPGAWNQTGHLRVGSNDRHRTKRAEAIAGKR